MFFIDKPYVSSFFKKTVRDFNIPIVDTDQARLFELDESTTIISQQEAIERVAAGQNLTVYTTSENAISWISSQPAFHELAAKIELFKNKFKFRELTQSLFEGFYYKELGIDDLKNLDLNEIPLPFIIKPTVGFFSMGVYKVADQQQWLQTIELIHAEMKQIQNLYPEEVLDTRSFIIEQIIEGEEFAIDAYFDASGAAVIVGIFKHVFSSDADVSDRVYMTSSQIINDNLAEFTDFVNNIGRLSAVKNFPVHIEVRRNADGLILPIEVNPMRFGGWCSTADMTYLAYGLNPYQSYYAQLKPDWPELLKNKEGKLFSIIVLDNSTGVEADHIQSFDYKKLLSRFEKPLELRQIDYRQYPVFGFLFTETRDDNFAELESILNSDLTEFITSTETNG